MRYALVTLAGMSNRIVEIPKSRHDATVEAKAALLECLFIEEKFDLVIENYLELERTLLDSALGYLAAPLLTNQRADTDRALFNRRLVNLLSSAGTYADQVRDGHTSPESFPKPVRRPSRRRSRRNTTIGSDTEPWAPFAITHSISMRQFIS